MANPPNSNTANSDSLAQITALQTAANNQFIAQAAEAIANAINEGKYWVTLTTFENCDINALQAYFIGIGYSVQYPDGASANLNPANPAQLFGEDFINFFENGGQFVTLQNPVRMKIIWGSNQF